VISAVFMNKGGGSLGEPVPVTSVRGTSMVVGGPRTRKTPLGRLEIR
jgi:hypothetical protein